MIELFKNRYVNICNNYILSILLIFPILFIGCGVKDKSVKKDVSETSDLEQIKTQPPGSAETGLVDKKTGKLTWSQPLLSLGATTSPDYSINLQYSTLGLYHSAVTWNMESQAIETGLGWGAPALHQRIFRNTRNTGYPWDDSFHLQAGGSSVELIYKETIIPNGESPYKVYTTTMSDYSQIRFYYVGDSLSDYDPETGESSITNEQFQPPYWEVISTDGTISHYGGYISKGNLFKVNGINPYKVDSETIEDEDFEYSYADITSGNESSSRSGKLCSDVQVNNDESNWNTDYQKPDSCNFLPVEYAVHWNAWMGAGAGTDGQQNIEIAWNLTEIESVTNGYATAFSYVCHMQAVGRVSTSENGLPFTLGCYMYQAAGADGSILAMNYTTPISDETIKEKSGKEKNKNSKDEKLLGDNPDSDEYVDNFMTDFEPDAYQEQYRVARLQGVDRYIGATKAQGMNFTQMASSEIDYEYLSQQDVIKKPSVKTVKHLVMDPYEDPPELKLAGPPVLFDYYDEDDGVSVNPNYDQFFNEGALYAGLKSVTTASGGKISFAYQKNLIQDFDVSYYVQSNASGKGGTIPNKSRVAFWGPDYMVLVGNSSIDNTDHGRIAVFNFTTSGWKLSTVFKTESTIVLNEDSPGISGPLASELVATADNFFVYLSPNDEGENTKICADVYVVSRLRGSSDADLSHGDWAEPVKLNGSDPFCRLVQNKWIQKFDKEGLEDYHYYTEVETPDGYNDAIIHYPSLDVSNNINSCCRRS